MAATKKDSSPQEALGNVLRAIIDEWYERVSGYYVTESEEGNPGADVQLKRFHDENGHRIKFNKDTLDFTYGLRATRAADSFHLDISVNNKVDEFDYEDFKRRLFDHYREAGRNRIEKPTGLKNLSLQEVFRLPSGISEAFTVEKRSGRADIMRLSFEINQEHVEALAKDPEATKQLVEDYCVSPFRKTYATVYRSTA